MMRYRGFVRSRLVRILAAALAGGTVVTSCDSRLKQSVVSGSQQYLFGFLNAEQVSGDLGDWLGLDGVEVSVICVSPCEGF